MKGLLFIRVATIAVIFLFVNKWNNELTTPLSIFSAIIHELGHAVGTSATGGEVSGFTLAPDCPCIYACTRGGNAWATVLGGNIFTLLTTFFFVNLGRIVSKITVYIFGTFVALSLLLFLTTRLIGDERILSFWIVVIYILLFVFFILTQTSWAGAFLIFFGFFNLSIIIKDLMTGGILSDISRYQHLSDKVPPMMWFAVWFGVVGYACVVLLMDVADTKVDWIEGKKVLKNLDGEKIWLFITLLPNFIGFAVDQGLEFLLVEFGGIFNGLRRFLQI